eukprot:1137752-Pelagomonas_calceolata.AAC.1
MAVCRGVCSGTSECGSDRVIECGYMHRLWQGLEAGNAEVLVQRPPCWHTEERSIDFPNIHPAAYTLTWLLLNYINA